MIDDSRNTLQKSWKIIIALTCILGIPMYFIFYKIVESMIEKGGLHFQDLAIPLFFFFIIPSVVIAHLWIVNGFVKFTDKSIRQYTLTGRRKIILWESATVVFKGFNSIEIISGGVVIKFPFSIYKKPRTLLDFIEKVVPQERIVNKELVENWPIS